jgi:hypothetical protein
VSISLFGRVKIGGDVREWQRPTSKNDVPDRAVRRQTAFVAQYIVEGCVANAIGPKIQNLEIKSP